MADYYRVPLMEVWQARPQTAEEVKSGHGEHSFATFLLGAFCRQIVDGHLAVAADLNGEDADDFVWNIECIYRALASQSVECDE